MKPTDEQRAIMASPGQVVKIKAGAGTGKTTTLRGLAARHPNDRILYLAFNKAIKEDAQGKFGPHVRAMTAHGLAYAHVGKHYGNVHNKMSHTDLKPFQVVPDLAGSLRGIPKALHTLYAARVIETVKAFLVSADPELGEQHRTVSGAAAETKYFHPEQMLTDAEDLWARMQDLSRPTPMVHDGYLKLFQLQNPSLPYGMLLLDEAQDTNPVTQALVGTQDARRIYVGDEHQAIYGFRGAHNAMASIEADATWPLTGSFRFGAAVADVANALLTAKGETLRLQGLGPVSVVGSLPSNVPHAYIARSNGSLFARAVQAIDQNTAFAFVGPLYSYRFDLIEQVHHLAIGRAVTDPFLKAFENVDELEAYADAMGDREWQGRVRIALKYGVRIPGLIASIQSKALTYPGPGEPFVVLTSAHRSKGLEFDHVQLSDDYLDFYDEDTGQWRDLVDAPVPLQEEVNLQYVAATRAKLSLELGGKLHRFVHRIEPSPRPPKAPGQERRPPRDRARSAS